MVSSIFGYRWKSYKSSCITNGIAIELIESIPSPTVKLALQGQTSPNVVFKPGDGISFKLK